MSEKLKSFILNKVFGRNCIIVATLTIVITSLAFSALPAFADPAGPDTTPTITMIHVNQNVVLSGDMVFTGYYNIPYATLPTLTADKLFIIRLFSTDGTTELGSVTPFAYSGFKNGYNEGAFSLYFTSSLVTSLGLVWDRPYILQIAENPSEFATPLIWNTTIATGDYTTLTTHADNQADLASQVFSLGSSLSATYNQSIFSTSGGSGSALTDIGEAYFRGAIPGLQNMAPSLFVIQVDNLDYTNTAWTTNAFDAYMTRFASSWVGAAQTAVGNTFGMSGNMAMGMIFIAPLCIILLVFSGMKFRTTDPGLIGAAVILEMGAVMGWVPAALFATIFQLMAIYIGYLIFFSRG